MPKHVNADKETMNRRWYDQEASCPKLLKQIQGMPQPEIREFCGRVLINFTEKVRKEINERDKRNQEVNSIGHVAIQVLYRYGEEKGRWYDQDPVLHKAVGTLYTLNLEGLGIVGFKLGDTFGLFQIYATVCAQLDQPADMREMARIATTSLIVGTREAEEILVNLVGQDLYNSLGHTIRHKEL
jgi:hypothetical protein